MKTKTRQLLMRFLSHTLLLSACFSADANNITTMDFGITAGLIGAGAALVGSGANVYAQGRMNKKTRQWNEKMYATQRKDALSDWQMQNEYNSPQQQMQRLQDAGLNPNLVYGNGAEAMSTQAPRQSDTGNWNPKAAEYGNIVSNGANAMMSYIDMKAKTAQTDNIKAQNEQIQEQVRSQQMDNAAKAITYLSDAETKVTTNDATKKYALEKAKQELKNLVTTGDVNQADVSLKGEQAINLGHQGNYTQRLVDTELLKQKIMKDENDRAWIMNSMNVAEAKARMVAMAYANAKSEEERKLIMENAKGKEFENWFAAGDKGFIEALGGSKTGAKTVGGVIAKGIEILLKYKRATAPKSGGININVNK